MTAPTPLQIAYRDLLIDIYEWREARKARELEFYRQALAAGELSVIPGKERTAHKCRCDVCLATQEPGIQKYWYQGKDGSRWFRVCDGCMSEIESRQRKSA